MSAWQAVRKGEGVHLAVLCEEPHEEAELLQRLHTEALRLTGTSGRSFLIPVQKDEFEPCVQHLRDLGFRGATIANPYKTHAARVAKDFFVARDSAGLATQLNFVPGGIYGRNTEIPAFGSILTGIPPQQALILGFSQRARAALVALLSAGWSVRVWNRGANRTRLLQTTFQRYGEIEMIPQPDPTGCALVVNATLLGKRIGEQPPLEWRYLRLKTLIGDLVVRELPTDFLREARTRGLPTVDARSVLAEQAALTLESWLEVPIPRESLLRAARKR